MKKKYVLIVALVYIHFFYGMETPLRATSPTGHTTNITFETNRPTQIQLMLSSKTDNGPETRYLLPEDASSYRITTGIPAIDNNNATNEQFTEKFLTAFEQVGVEMQDWQTYQSSLHTQITNFPTLIITPLLQFLQNVTDFELSQDTISSREQSQYSSRPNRFYDSRKKILAQPSDDFTQNHSYLHAQEKLKEFVLNSEEYKELKNQNDILTSTNDILADSNELLEQKLKNNYILTTKQIAAAGIATISLTALATTLIILKFK